MSGDEAALIRLWREKRGETESEDLSDNLVVQLGVATEALNRTWYERNTGRRISDVQRRVQHPINRWMAATLDDMVEDPDAVFEAKFMLPWSFSEDAAADKHWHSYNTTCGSPTPAQRRSPSSPAGANGSR
jgi:predicted phage-related endonuclease